MSATVDVSQIIEVIGLVGGDESYVIKFTSAGTPAETVNGRPIISNAAFSLKLGDIAVGSGFCLYLEALVGNLYVALGWEAGDDEVSATTAQLYIPEGEGYIIPINPNATAMPGIRILSDEATTGQISYRLIGK